MTMSTSQCCESRVYIESKALILQSLRDIITREEWEKEKSEKSNTNCVTVKDPLKIVQSKLKEQLLERKWAAENQICAAKMNLRKAKKRREEAGRRLNVICKKFERHWNCLNRVSKQHELLVSAHAKLSAAPRTPAAISPAHPSSPPRPASSPAALRSSPRPAQFELPLAFFGLHSPLLPLSDLLISAFDFSPLRRSRIIRQPAEEFWSALGCLELDRLRFLKLPLVFLPVLFRFFKGGAWSGPGVTSSTFSDLYFRLVCGREVELNLGVGVLNHLLECSQVIIGSMQELYVKSFTKF